MQKVRRHVLAVAGRIFFIGFSVQIVLGLLWMVCNFRALFLLQLVVAFWAAYRLLCNITDESGQGEFFRIWGSLAMLTFPLAMQCHLASGPDSLTGSCLLLELAFTTGILGKRCELCYKEFAKVLFFWIMAALLQPEYLLFGAVPVVILSVYAVKNVNKAEAGKQHTQNKLKREKVSVYLMLMVLSAGLILGIGTWTGFGFFSAGTSEDGVRPSLSFSLASRFAWPRVGMDYDFWPEEVREHLSRQQAMQTDFYADNMELVLGRTLEDALGEERAKEMFAEIARGAWQRHKSEIIHDTAWDALGYTFSPIVLQRQLTGKVYDSYSGRNYDFMRVKTPLLTKYYLDYGCWWFAVGLGMTAVLYLMEGLRNYVTRRRGIQEVGHATRLKYGCTTSCVVTVIMCFLTSGSMIVWYTMRGAGMMDYKKTTAVGLLWLWWMLTVCIRSLSVLKE